MFKEFSIKGNVKFHFSGFEYSFKLCQSNAVSNLWLIINN